MKFSHFYRFLIDLFNAQTVGTIVMRHPSQIISLNLNRLPGFVYVSITTYFFCSFSVQVICRYRYPIEIDILVKQLIINSKSLHLIFYKNCLWKLIELSHLWHINMVTSIIIVNTFSTVWHRVRISIINDYL